MAASRRPGCPALRCPTPGCAGRAGHRVARPVQPAADRVTGSNGKTTVTQMIASILRAWKGDAALCHAGQLQQRHRRAADAAAPARQPPAAVVELGMNHPAKSPRWPPWPSPRWRWSTTPSASTWSSCTPCRPWREENGSCWPRCPPTAWPCSRQVMTYTPLWRRWRRAPLHHLWRGGRCACARSQLGSKGPGRCEMPPRRVRCAARCTLPAAQRAQRAGRHACALAAGVPLDAVAQGLEAFEPVKGRSRALLRAAWRGAHHAGGRQLQRQPRLGARRHRRAGRSARTALLVLGDMGEVGDQGPQFHAEAGARARAALSTFVVRWARSRPTPPGFGAAHNILTDMASLQARCARRCPRWAACW
jgi:UDP-N-acetylmuramoyl-tripeptide--D-alanyl-D-alanine ligase